MAKFADRIGKIAEGVTEGYQKIEDGVVTGYKKIEDGIVTGMKKIEDGFTGAVLNEDGSMKTGKVGEAVVGAYKKVEGAFVNTFMVKEGESVEDAKTRATAGTKAIQAKIAADAKAREAKQKTMIEESLEASRNAGKLN